MKKLILSSFALVAFVLISNSAFAQPYSQNSTLGVEIKPVVELTKTTDILGAGLVFNNAAELISGVQTAVNAVVLNYKSNVNTHVSIKAENFTSATVATGMNVGVLMFNTDGSENYSKTMTTTGQLLSGTSEPTGGNAAGSGDINIRYKVTPGLLYAPANDYTTTITYTITAN